MPRSHLQNLKEFPGRIEVSRANLHEYKLVIVDTTAAPVNSILADGVAL